MDNKDIVIHVWTCLTIVLVSFNVCQMIFKTYKVYKTSGGTEISFDTVGLAGILFVCSAYYLSKFLLK